MNNNKKKIIILGSSGFIGKNLISYFLCNELYDIFYCNRSTVNILNENELNTFIESIKPDIIINCAGIVGSSESNKQNHDEYNIFHNNILLNMNVLNSCKKYNVSKLIHFSTYRAFGDDICENYNESNFHSCYNISNNKGYLFSKKILDLQIQLFKQNSSTEIICLVLPNIFGSHDNFDFNGRIIPALITKMHYAKKEGTDLYLNTNCNNLVNLIYIEDVFNIVFNCIKDDFFFKEGNIIVFNKKGTITLKKITEILKKQMDFHNNIIFSNDSEINNRFIMQPDISTFDSIFKNYTFYDIEKGLQETIDFLQSN